MHATRWRLPWKSNFCAVCLWYNRRCIERDASGRWEGFFSRLIAIQRLSCILLVYAIKITLIMGISHCRSGLKRCYLQSSHAMVCSCQNARSFRLNIDCPQTMLVSGALSGNRPSDEFLCILIDIKATTLTIRDGNVLWEGQGQKSLISAAFNVRHTYVYTSRNARYYCIVSLCTQRVPKLLNLSGCRPVSEFHLAFR